MRHIRYVIFCAFFSFFGLGAAFAALDVSADNLRLTVSEDNLGFLLSGKTDASPDFVPLLDPLDFGTSVVSVYADGDLLDFDLQNALVRRYIDNTVDIISSYKSGNLDVTVDFGLVRSDNAPRCDSLMIKIEAMFHRAARADKLAPPPSDKPHDFFVKICYDTYLGEKNRRPFAVRSDKPVKEDSGDKPKRRKRKSKSKIAEPPNITLIESECEFTKYAARFVSSSDTPDALGLYLFTHGGVLTSPTRIYFANRHKAQSAAVYEVTFDAPFGDKFTGREDSAAFFEYDIHDIKDEQPVTIVAAVGLNAAAVFGHTDDAAPDSMQNVSPAQNADQSDDGLKQLIDGINIQLNDKKQVSQSGVENTQNILDKIKSDKK